MQFRFRLAPVNDIFPWGTEKGGLRLSWFGLTDGWFWVEVGGQELFRYTQEIRDYFGRQYPEAEASLLPYTDYQVVRYWEDLLEMLPTILDPIPPDFAARVADTQGLRAWQDAARDWMEECNDEASWDIYHAAVLWQSERTWDAGHLVHPPHIWLWRLGDTIHIRWDNHDVKIEGIPVWEAQQGEVTLPVSDFIAAVESFHERFLSEMGKRVDEAVAAWPRPDVKIDLAHLLHEQEERQRWLEPAITPWAAETWRGFSWNDVRAAMATIANELTPIASIQGMD